MRLLTVITALCLAAHPLSGQEDNKAEKDFESLTLTRCWALGMWRVNDCKEHDDQSKNFKLSMTAQAFRYWVLVQKGLIVPNLAHESQIRKAFESGELSADTLKNPLYRNSEYQGGFGIGGVVMNAAEYATRSVEFERFVNSEDNNPNNKRENKSEQATPRKPSD